MWFLAGTLKGSWVLSILRAFEVAASISRIIQTGYFNKRKHKLTSGDDVSANANCAVFGNTRTLHLCSAAMGRRLTKANGVLPTKKYPLFACSGPCCFQRVCSGTFRETRRRRQLSLANHIIYKAEGYVEVSSTPECMFRRKRPFIVRVAATGAGSKHYQYQW